ncbi:MAG: hypothetical protein ACRD8O_14840, partial [Bryobacteraceae bacterium]
RPARAEWMGAALGAGLLAKAYFVAAVPAVFLLFAQARQAARALQAFAVTALVAGWWYWRNRQATGVWSGVPDDAAAHHASLSRWIDGILQTRWAEALDSTLLSHLWFGNWSFLQVRSWMYHFFYLVIALAAAGLFWRMRRGARTLVPLVLFYGFFWAALAYSVLITYLARGVSATTGWYLYCLVIVEVILATAGLAALLPRSAHRAILPAGAFCFMALDLYATHFVLIPYYTGLIAHRPGGGVTAFHLDAGARLGWGELIRRLCVNKPDWVTPEALVAGWLLFLAATAAAFFITLAPSRAPDSGMLDVK